MCTDPNKEYEKAVKQLEAAGSFPVVPVETGQSRTLFVEICNDYGTFPIYCRNSTEEDEMGAQNCTRISHNVVECFAKVQAGTFKIVSR